MRADVDAHGLRAVRRAGVRRGGGLRPAPGVAAVAAERSRRLREGLWTVCAARAPAGPRGGLFDARRARRRVLRRGRLPGPGRRRLLHAGARERAAGPHAARGEALARVRRVHVHAPHGVQRRRALAQLGGQGDDAPE